MDWKVSRASSKRKLRPRFNSSNVLSVAVSGFEAREGAYIQTRACGFKEVALRFGA
jgi:hypothetical protein